MCIFRIKRHQRCGSRHPCTTLQARLIVSMPSHQHSLNPTQWPAVEPYRNDPTWRIDPPAGCPPSPPATIWCPVCRSERWPVLSTCLADPPLIVCSQLRLNSNLSHWKIVFVLHLKLQTSCKSKSFCASLSNAWCCTVRQHIVSNTFFAPYPARSASMLNTSISPTSCFWPFSISQHTPLKRISLEALSYSTCTNWARCTGWKSWFLTVKFRLMKHSSL